MPLARAIVGDEPGHRSIHALPAQFDAGARRARRRLCVRRPDMDDADQAGTAGGGTSLLSHAASAASAGRPWFAIGGIENLRGSTR